VPGIEPGPPDLQPRTLTTRPQRRSLLLLPLLLLLIIIITIIIKEKEVMAASKKQTQAFPGYDEDNHETLHSLQEISKSAL
jgi:hypothetical protein